MRGLVFTMSLTVGLIAGACAQAPACTDPSAQPIDPDAPAPNASHPPPAPKTTLGLYGTVYEGCEGTPVAQVCITVGVPGNICWAKTDKDGNYELDLAGIVDPEAKTFFSLTFIKTGYATDRSKSFEFTTTRVHRVDHRMQRE